MDTNSWSTIQKTFEKALQLKGVARNRYVHQQCCDDKKLIQQVNQLLSADDNSDQYLNHLSENLYPLINEQFSEGRIGRYQLQERLGEGGMGIVYRGFDEELQRLVAIKFLPILQANNPKAKERFIQEAKAAAQLNHPNVCDVFEINEKEDGQLYIVSAFCEGNNLNLGIENNHFTLAEVLKILIQLCDALSATHAKQIYHRDLKPANVIVDHSLLVKLVDFGIAKIAGDNLSQTGEVVGTVAYMSPEQFSAGNVDQRTDIWSMGIMLFEMLTGQRPFHGDNPAAIMYEVFNGKTPLLPITDFPLSDQFNQILRRCLSIDKQGRFQTTALLKTEFKNLQQQLQQHQLNEYPLRDFAKKRATPLATRSYSECRQVIAMAVIFQTEKNAPSHSDKIDGNKFSDQIKTVIGNYQGQITNHSNGQLFAYFGYPKLQEGAADNALNCAFKLQQNWPNIQQKFPTITQVILNGVRVILSANKHTDNIELCGDLPLSFDELIKLSPPHPILVSQAVNRRLRKPLSLATRWHYQSNLNDKLPTTFFSLTEQLHHQFLTNHPKRYPVPMLGREHELGLLNSAWSHTIEGDTRAMLISGEAGIGKTRLVAAFKESICQNINTKASLSIPQIIECSCDPNQSDNAFYPIAKSIKEKLVHNKYYFSEDNNVSNLEHWLKDLNINTANALPVMNRLLDFDSDQTNRLLLSESPQALKDKTLKLLQIFFEQQAQKIPLLLILEDLHWADTNTLEWIDQLLSESPLHNIMLVLTGRPEMFERWRCYKPLTQLALGKLAQLETQKLIGYICQQNKHSIVELTERWRQKISQKTAGNPLFIEEYTSMLLGRNLSIDDKMSNRDIPDSLEDILYSRFDRLGAVKIVAQNAAVIGRVFDCCLVASLMKVDTKLMSRYLSELVESDIIYNTNVEGEQYVFKHALIRDALYNSLPAEQQCSNHLVLAKLFEKQQKPVPDLIARHFSAAEQANLAAPWWLKAAKKALQNHAVRAAITSARKGLSELEKCPTNLANLGLQFSLYMTLGPALSADIGYSDPKVGSTYQHALRLSEKLGDQSQIGPLLLGLWASYCGPAKHNKALQIAERLICIAEEDNSDDLRVEAYMMKGVTLYFFGKIEQASSSLQIALNCYRAEMAEPHIRQFGQNPAMNILTFQALIADYEKNPDKAKALSQRAVSVAREIEHPLTLSYALAFAGHLYIRLGLYNEAEIILEENQLLCDTHGIHFFRFLGNMQKGVMLLNTRQVKKGVEVVLQSIDNYTRMGGGTFLPSWHGLLAATYIKLGEIEKARAELYTAKQIMQKNHEWLHQPMLKKITQLLESIAKEEC